MFLIALTILVKFISSEANFVSCILTTYSAYFIILICEYCQLAKITLQIFFNLVFFVINFNFLKFTILFFYNYLIKFFFTIRTSIFLVSSPRINALKTKLMHTVFYFSFIFGINFIKTYRAYLLFFIRIQLYMRFVICINLILLSIPPSYFCNRHY
jgi:hypothetical protein